MHLLITRPEPDAGRLAAHLRALGYEVSSAPLMQIRSAGTAPDLHGVRALAFTSANGVRAFAALTAARDLPVLAVGASTAEAAHAAGFTDVEAAAGDVESLAALVAARISPGGGPVLHAAGRHLAGDLAQLLARAGVEVRRQALYEAQAAESLPPEAAAALAGNPSPLHGALFFSPRSARLFERLVTESGLTGRLKPITAFCLSPAVAEALTPRHWGRIATAPAPDRLSLLALLPPPEERPSGGF